MRRKSSERTPRPRPSACAGDGDRGRHQPCSAQGTCAGPPFRPDSPGAQLLPHCPALPTTFPCPASSPLRGSGAHTPRGPHPSCLQAQRQTQAPPFLPSPAPPGPPALGTLPALCPQPCTEGSFQKPPATAPGPSPRRSPSGPPWTCWLPQLSKFGWLGVRRQLGAQTGPEARHCPPQLQALTHTTWEVCKTFQHLPPQTCSFLISVEATHLASTGPAVTAALETSRTQASLTPPPPPGPLTSLLPPSEQMLQRPPAPLPQPAAPAPASKAPAPRPAPFPTCRPHDPCLLLLFAPGSPAWGQATGQGWRQGLSAQETRHPKPPAPPALLCPVPPGRSNQEASSVPSPEPGVQSGPHVPGHRSQRQPHTGLSQKPQETRAADSWSQGQVSLGCAPTPALQT